MGFFNKVFGGASGIREAMQESYEHHARLAESRGDPPHRIGLYGALASRYKVSRRATSEMQLWAELAPFIAMGPVEGIRWLAEYVVHQERPEDADAVGLSDALDHSLEAPLDSELLDLAAVAYSARVPWRSLLGSQSLRKLKDVVGIMENWS